MPNPQREEEWEKLRKVATEYNLGGAAIKNGYMGEFKGYQIGDTFYIAVKHECDNCASARSDERRRLTEEVEEIQFKLGAYNCGDHKKLFNKINKLLATLSQEVSKE